ncbi:GNAT family N-acetyltransferase [Halomonas sp. C05BenzN]|uniref:GNAT family N-acetyltransferase n=1 Tax=Halomonas sp. C05BenzN TaxID=3411041 RepID=UPI003B938910
MKSDPLFHPGWIRFNEQRWGLTAETVTLAPDRGDAWRLDTVLYRNARGRLVTPPRNPHLPVDFRCASERPASVNRRKRLALTRLAECLRENGLGGSLSLSSVADDVRPFEWARMTARPRFTYHLDIADRDQRIDPSARKKARKCRRLDYDCEITHDYAAVAGCLAGPEARRGFDYRLGADELERLAGLMGPDHFVCFLARNARGEPMGTRVCLYTPGGHALAWSAGMKTEAMKDGVNNLVAEEALAFFADKGCTVFDFIGANIPPVAEMKEAWGGRLVCHYAISQRGVRQLAREAYITARTLLKRESK